MTVTHPEITRYFMSIPEAARLVLQSVALAESGQVYVLDMGEPVKIVDLAKNLIRLSQHRDGEIAIVYTGLRPGEKLYEELLSKDEQTLPSAHPRLRIAILSGGTDSDLLDQLAELAAPGRRMGSGEVKQWLAGVVPEYQRTRPVRR